MEPTGLEERAPEVSEQEGNCRVLSLDLPLPGQSTGPTTQSHWIVRGLLLAGAYPREGKSGDTAATCRALVDAGVRVFVCLLSPEELESFAPYRQHMPDPIEHIAFPIPDGGVAESVQGLVDLACAIHGWISDKRCVYSK